MLHHFKRDQIHSTSQPNSTVIGEKEQNIKTHIKNKFHIVRIKSDSIIHVFVKNTNDIFFRYNRNKDDDIHKSRAQ